jgi:hypothetical protein
MDLQLQASWTTLSVLARRDAIMGLEDRMRSLEDEQGIEIPPIEYHCNGVYAREIHIPAGVALVGEIHLQAQINVVSKGVIRVFTEDGVKTITAPHTFISPAGTKRAGYVVEDTVWTVFHATTSEDGDEIRKEFIAPNYQELDKQLEVTYLLDSDSNSSNNRVNLTAATTSKKGTRTGA